MTCVRIQIFHGADAISSIFSLACCDQVLDAGRRPSRSTFGHHPAASPVSRRSAENSSAQGLHPSKYLEAIPFADPSICSGGKQFITILMKRRMR